MRTLLPVLAVLSLSLSAVACGGGDSDDVDGGAVGCTIIGNPYDASTIAACGDGFTLHACDGTEPDAALGCTPVEGEAGRFCCPHVL